MPWKIEGLACEIMKADEPRQAWTFRVSDPLLFRRIRCRCRKAWSLRFDDIVCAWNECVPQPFGSNPRCTVSIAAPAFVRCAMDNDQDKAYRPPPSPAPEDRRGGVADERADAQAGHLVPGPVPTFLGFNVPVDRVQTATANSRANFRTWADYFWTELEKMTYVYVGYDIFLDADIDLDADPLSVCLQLSVSSRVSSHVFALFVSPRASSHVSPYLFPRV